MNVFKPKPLLVIIISLSLIFSGSTASASIFGEETLVLAQILANAIQELIQLKQILGASKDSLSLMEEINKGINDSLALYKTIYPNADPGLYSDWRNPLSAIQKLQGIYGVIVPSADSRVQHDTDQQIVEAVALNNSIYEYAGQIDQIGEDVKRYSHEVSPGGAQKLTAQTLGVMLHVLNQQLRAQATGLKLQSQSLALENKKEKDSSRLMLESSGSLALAMKNDKIKFDMPRFE